MAYAYPAPRSGTAQDLFRAVTRAHELQIEREGVCLPCKSGASRFWIEPIFRAVGVALAGIVEMIPADWNIGFHNCGLSILSSPSRYAFDPESLTVARASSLALELEKRSGKVPAMLALISHPPVMGDLAHLNFELARHAILALRAVRGRPCRPRLVTAIDPFALDTASIVEEGLYAGYMGTFHIGLDRLALGRGRPGVALTPLAAWNVMPMRLLRALSEGSEVGLALSGGVPSTSRVLYVVREWARAAREVSPLRARPGEVARALRAAPAFANFEKACAAADASVPTRAWRLIDAWLMFAAAGLLPTDTIAAVAVTTLSCLAVPEERRQGLLSELARDFSRETPRRRRLFRLLAGRVARHRPLLIIPIVHRMNPPGVTMGEAWSWEWIRRGRLATCRADNRSAAIEMSPEEFTDRFVQENFA